METMSDTEVRDALARGRLAVLSLARSNIAYAFPLFYKFDGRSVHFHSHPGDKDHYIESTEEACLVVVDARTEDVWTSVMAFGPVRAVRTETEIRLSMAALAHIPPPPAEGRSELGEPMRLGEGVRFWRMLPTRLSGRKSERPPLDAEAWRD